MPRRRVSTALRCLLYTALLLGAMAPAATAQEAVGVQGSLAHEDEPVEEAVILIETADGEELGEATSDDEGDWSFDLPAAGAYRATLVEDSLPEGVGLRDAGRATLEFTLSAGQRRTLIFSLGQRESTASRWIPRIAQSTANGLKFGLIIAMTAIGLSLIFGTTGLVNFAHGDLVTFGAVVAYFANTRGPQLQLIPAAILAMVAGGLFGGLLERGLWRPLRRRRTGLIQLLVISIGLALVVRHLILIVMGGRSRPYLDYTVQRAIALGPIQMTPRDIVVVLLSFAVLIGVGLLLQRTRIGKAMRAVADNRDLAESSGIDVQRVILVVWVLGGVLAALGGVFLGVVENVNWNMGFRLLLLMFAGVILGGLGTAFGAMLGSILVGLVTELSTLWFSTELKFVWALAVMILVLMVRPQGLLGVKERIG